MCRLVTGLSVSKGSDITSCPDWVESVEKSFPRKGMQAADCWVSIVGTELGYFQIPTLPSTLLIIVKIFGTVHDLLMVVGPSGNLVSRTIPPTHWFFSKFNC